jgi:hypothetical protein
LTPVPISALTANYALQPDNSYHPVTNYGGETDYNWSTSNFVQTNEFGSYFAGFSFGGDANFVATLNRVIHGDFNDDGQVGADDIHPMLVALTDLTAYQASHQLSHNDLVLLADFNGDQSVTNSDIQSFLNFLAASGLGAGSTAVPEPSTAALVSGVILIFLYVSYRQQRARSFCLAAHSATKRDVDRAFVK